MVDIHSHVLPGLDDGARTTEESLEMLRIAKSTGTTDIVATPHINAEFRNDSAQIQEAYGRLCAEAKLNIEINIHLACDFHLSYENLTRALAEPQKYTINGHQYLMVELPDLLAFSAIRDALKHLLSAGIIPIITHPERNMSLQPRLEELESWVKEGALVQVTAQSLTGRFGPMAKHAADSLLSAKLLHFVASDAHDSFDRTPDLSSAFAYVRSHCSREQADSLFTQNPAATLRGEPLPQAQKFSRKFFGLFNRTK
jgi:protein-tyrosine phosphatase